MGFQEFLLAHFVAILYSTFDAQSLVSLVRHCCHEILMIGPQEEYHVDF